MGKGYISKAYDLHDYSYHVTEDGYISERNHRMKTRQRFQLSDEDINRLQRIALKYKHGDVLQAEKVRDIFYGYVILSLSHSRNAKVG